MQISLIFVYNINRKPLRGIKELARRFSEPGSQGCCLHAVTHGPFGMKKDWRQFILSLPVAVRFMDREELSREFGISDAALPAVFLQQDGEIQPWLEPGDLSRCTTLPELKVLVRRRLKRTIEENGWDWLQL